MPGINELNQECEVLEAFINDITQQPRAESHCYQIYRNLSSLHKKRRKLYKYVRVPLYRAVLDGVPLIIRPIDIQRHYNDREFDITHCDIIAPYARAFGIKTKDETFVHKAFVTFMLLMDESSRVNCDQLYNDVHARITDLSNTVQALCHKFVGNLDKQSVILKRPHKLVGLDDDEYD